MGFPTKDSLIEWAGGWVPDIPPGQRARFTAALADELKHWRMPEAKPRYCKHCPFAEHVHHPDVNGQNGCPGFEWDESKT